MQRRNDESLDNEITIRKKITSIQKKKKEKREKKDIREIREFIYRLPKPRRGDDIEVYEIKWRVAGQATIEIDHLRSPGRGSRIIGGETRS